MKRWLASSLLCLLMACAGGVRGQGAAGAGSLPAPQLAAGLMLRYQLGIRATHQASVSGAVENPQGGAQVTLRFNATLTLQALEPQAGAAQVRATVEQVSIAVSGDTFDPALAAMEEQYRKLEGFSTHISRGSAHHSATSTNVPGAPAEQWLRALLGRIVDGAGVMQATAGVSEQPVDAAPLRGTVLRVHSTYLRDEPCGGQGERAASAVASLAVEPCAVILTRSTLAQTGSRRDQTPPGYRAHGLRTAGRWEGTGESLAYVARRTGWVVSITESQSEQVDFTIRRAEGEVVHHQRGRIETQTNLLLQSVESGSAGL